jgi:hypothetical protein
MKWKSKSVKATDPLAKAGELAQMIANYEPAIRRQEEGERRFASLQAAARKWRDRDRAADNGVTT